MSTEVVTVRGEGLTLARVIWQFVKRQPPGYLERVLDANPGLADKGHILPVGTQIVFPLDDIPTARNQRPIVKLWD